MCQECQKEMSRPIRITLAAIIIGMGIALLGLLFGGYTIDVGKMYKEYRHQQRMLAISKVPIPMRPGFIPRAIESLDEDPIK